MSVLAPFFTTNSSSPVVHNKREAHEYVQALYWVSSSLMQVIYGDYQAGETSNKPRWCDLIGVSIIVVIIFMSYVVIVTSCVLINRFLK